MSISKKTLTRKSLIVLPALALVLPAVPFSVKRYRDGGTKDYTALLYKIVKWNRRYDEEKGSMFAETKVYFFPKSRLTVDELFEEELRRGNIKETYISKIRQFSDFEKEWLRLFAGCVSQEDIDHYVVDYGNSIWHVFSWELLDKNSYLVGDAARAAFDAENKSGAIWYEPFNDEQDADLHPEQFSAEMLDDRTECYVMAEDRSWSYIVTHEGNCGPYFIKAIVNSFDTSHD